MNTAPDLLLTGAIVNFYLITTYARPHHPASLSAPAHPANPPPIKPLRRALYRILMLDNSGQGAFRQHPPGPSTTYGDMTMLLVPCSQLKVGMVLAQPVFHPACKELVLLNSDYVLEAEMIKRLNAFDLTHVWVRFPGLDELDSVPNERIARAHAVLCETINTSIGRLEGRLEVKANLYRIKQAIAQMVTEIVVHHDHEVITHQLASCGPQLSGHLGNCCYLSLLLGAQMSGYLVAERRAIPAKVAENTSQLGLGALLHDVGKLNMEETLKTKSILDEESAWPEYRLHVQAGYEMVRETTSVLAANVVLNHHQRFDGSGFPDKQPRHKAGQCTPLSGRQIHIFSRIVAVVDAFDHLLCPNGQPVPTIVAIHQLKSERFAGWFDPAVVETLLRLVPPFMVGSVVKLSDGTEAVVVENHPEAPCRPSVKLLSGPICERNTRVRGRTLDMRMCRTLTIASIDGFDVRPYLFSGELEPEPEPEPEVATIW